MTTKADWIALAERFEKAKTRDRALGVDILKAAGWKWLPDSSLDNYWHDAEGGVVGKFFNPVMSLDDVVVLIERELPDYHWRIQGGCKDTGWTQMSGDPRAYIKAKASRLVQHTDGKDGEAATPALALCAAFCRAMAEKEPT